MMLEFGTEALKTTPRQPEPLGHRANELARRFADTKQSRERREKKYREKQNEPAYVKIREAVASRIIFLYAFLAVFLLPTLYWEWEVSREIYQVRLPVTPVIPFLVFVGLAFASGALFAEATPAFSILADKPKESDNPGEQEIRKIYGRRKRLWPPGCKTLCLLGAIALAIVVLVPIFRFSQERVVFLKEAGELTEDFASTDLWLPMMLYGLEIALGMPASFIIVAFLHYISLTRERRKLTREIDLEHELNRLTISTYYQYVHALEAFQRAAGNEGQGRCLIPPNSALRELLVGEFGYDPTRAGGPPERQLAGAGDIAAAEENPPAKAMPPGGGREAGEGQRVEDLLNIVDQQIDEQNRTL